VVARDLDIAPTTVRHHLRAIYTKLGISDKGQIAQIVWQETEPQP
jgi:DNA-binding CsgD family transcriptional regulator